MSNPIVIDSSEIANISERFWGKVDMSPGYGPRGDCWRWTGALSGGRYGAFNVAGRDIGAHRMSFYLSRNKWPENLACHSCDQMDCVRPNHIFDGTQKQNIEDALSKGRMATGERSGSRIYPERRPTGSRHGRYTKPGNTARGERNGMALITADDVIRIRAAIPRSKGYRGAMDSFALELGVPWHAIWKIVNNRNWTTTA